MVSKKQRNKAKEGSKKKAWKPSNEPFRFLDLPREIRDKIYNHLLIARLDPTTQSTYSSLLTTPNPPGGEFGRENALEHLLSSTFLFPAGGPESTPNFAFLQPSKGLFTANKQVYSEATDVLFGKNTFVVLPFNEYVWPFWTLLPPIGVLPERYPKRQFVRSSNLAEIKHLRLIILNPRSYRDPFLATESAVLQENLATIVHRFSTAGTKLKTLHVRYTSCFGGEIEAVREHIEGPVPEGIFDRPVSLKDHASGRFMSCRRSQADERLFRHHRLLDPLRSFKVIAEEVKVCGDLPQGYMDELAGIMATTDVSQATRRRLEKEKEAAALRSADRAPDLADFAKTMLEENRDADEETREFYRELMRTSVKGPSVMAELFRPPSEADYARWRRGSPPPELQRPAGEEDGLDSEEDEEGMPPLERIESASRRVREGEVVEKPFFGPERPPHMR